MRKTSAPAFHGDLISPTDKLLALADLIEGTPLGCDFAVAIREVIAAEGRLSLDKRVGLIPDPGHESPWRTEQRRERDRLIRQLGERLARGRSIAARAREVKSALTGYSRTWSRCDATHEACPYLAGTTKELLFRIFDISRGRALPIGLSRLRDIISGRDLPTS